MLTLRVCLFRFGPGLLLAIACAAHCPAADDFAGTLKSIHGQVSIRRKTKLVPAVLGEPLLVEDIIETQADGSAGIILHDGTRLSLGPNSALTVEDFVFDPSAGKLNLLIRVLRGVAAYASGKIAQLSPQSAHVETPVGVIGLRGTQFAVSLSATSAAVK